MNATQEDRFLKNILAQVQTPVYDPTNKVMEHIHSQSKIKRPSRVLLIAATLCVAFVFLGAARVFGWISFDLSGNIESQLPMQGATPLPEDRVSISPDEEMAVFIDQAVLGEVRLVFNEDGTGMAAIGSMRGKSEKDILALLGKCEFRLETPGYIPDGYMLTESIVEFYLTQSDMKAEETASYRTNDRTYKAYRLPGGYQSQIESVRLFYENAKGEFLRYEAMLTEALAANVSFGIGAPDTAVAEALTVAGYEKGVLIYDKARLNEISYSSYLYKQVPIIKEISPFAIDQEWRDNRPYEETLSAVVYSVEAEALGRDEVLMIMNSIQ